MSSEDIYGTFEVLLGTSLAGRDEDGSPEHAGETVIHWDAAETVTDSCGRIVWTDRSGNSFVIEDDERIPVNVDVRTVVTRKDRLTEGTLEMRDLFERERCGVFDDEIRQVLDADNLVEFLDAGGGHVARKDPETGDVWLACWFRVRSGGES